MTVCPAQGCVCSYRQRHGTALSHTWGASSAARVWCLCFFFFQAEDGIRDLTVTGVQTCALPISKRQVKDRCTTETPCTFDAKAHEGNWHVRVQFTKRNSPRDKAYSYPGGHAIFVEIGRASCRERV